MTTIHKEGGYFQVEEEVRGKNLLSDDEITNTSASNAVTVDWGGCQYQNVTSNENTTVTFTAPKSTGLFGLKLILSSGPITITWPGTVKWAGGSGPAPGDGTHLLLFYFDGTNYYEAGRFLSLA